jgi:hypothetical protein
VTRAPRLRAALACSPWPDGAPATRVASPTPNRRCDTACLPWDPTVRLSLWKVRRNPPCKQVASFPYARREGVPACPERSFRGLYHLVAVFSTELTETDAAVDPYSYISILSQIIDQAENE